MDYKIICLAIMTLLFGALWVLIHFRGQNKLLSRVFNIFVLNMVVWAFGLTMFYFSSDLKQSLFWARVLYMAGGLVPPAFLLYSFVFSHRSLFLSLPKIVLLFLPNLIFFYLYFFTPWMVKEIAIVRDVKTFVFGPAHFLWDINFNAVFLTAFVRFIRLYRKADGLVKEHLKYIISGTFIGYVLAGTTNVVMLWFGNFSLIWLGPPLTSTWLLFIAYTIIKHRILDLRIVIARSTIFILVYSFVLGFPFWLSFQKVPWIVPMLLMAVLGSAGAFIYQYLQHRVEERLLEEQRRYQDALRKTAVGMNRIHEVKMVFNLITDLITSRMKVEYTLVYALDEEKQEYIALAAKYAAGHTQGAFPEKIPADSPLAGYLKASRGIAAYDDAQVTRVLSELRFRDVLVLPVLIKGDVRAMVIVGKKQNSRIFTADDLSVLMTLANQTAVAMESCYLWAAVVKRMEEEGLKARSTSIDRMGGSIAHEIDNPNTVIINEAGYLKELLERDKSIILSPQQREEIIKALDNIIEYAKRISVLIDAILEHSKLGAGNLKPVSINEAVGDFLKIINPRVRQENADFQVQVDPNLSLVTDKVEVMEILMNLTLNALHAVRDNRGRGKCVMLKVFLAENGIARVEVTDNGYGIPAHMMEAIFLPSVTTKSADGTGLGLYRIKKIVDRYNGKAWAESQGTGKGARFIVELPVYKGEMPGNGQFLESQPKVAKIRKLR